MNAASPLQPPPSPPPLAGAPIRRPTARFMLSHPAHIVALGFGSGLSPIAPGTAGTLWAWLAFLVMRTRLDDAQIGLVIAFSLLIGWWACSVTARHMRVADPGHIVWDEVVAFWLVLWLVMPAGPVGQVCAFALFRFFDAAKPGPVAWADGLFKSHGVPETARGWWPIGFGILLDDLVAALCTLLVIALWRWL